MNISIRIIPPLNAKEGTRVFTFKIKSRNFNFSETKYLYLRVKRGVNIFISDVRVNKQTLRPDETLRIWADVDKSGGTKPSEVSVLTRIIKSDLIVDEFSDTLVLKPDSKKTIKHNFEVGIHNPYGEYSIMIRVFDHLGRVVDEKNTSFMVEKVYNITKHKSTRHGVLSTLVTIHVKNEGNVPESKLSIEDSLPYIFKYFFHPYIEPSSERRKDNRIVYTWDVGILNPGESTTIEYRLRFVNVVVISLILAFSALFALRWFFRPVLSKTSFGSLVEGEELTITLHVKNKGRRILKNLVVKDFVPALARVVRKFDTLPPELKRKDLGTELTWRIKKLKPGEERILTYRIKPIIEIVGDFKLPKAHLTYETRKGRGRMIVSKTITVKAKS